MNRLLYTRNDVYYYLINDSARKNLNNMFNILGNINNKQSYDLFIKKYNFKPFSFCYNIDLFKYAVPKNGLVIAIDSVTQELYLPSKNECSHNPNFMNDYMSGIINEIIDKHFMKEYKKQMDNVIEELKLYFDFDKKCHVYKMNRVFNEMKQKAHSKKMNAVLNELFIKNEIDTIINNINESFVVLKPDVLNFSEVLTPLEQTDLETPLDSEPTETRDPLLDSMVEINESDNFVVRAPEKKGIFKSIASYFGWSS